MSNSKQVKVAKVGRPRQNVRKSQKTARRSVTTVLPSVTNPKHVTKALTFVGGNTGPPRFVFQQAVTLRRRYVATAAFNGTFSIQSGNNQFLCATAAALCNCIAESWRIKKVEMWSAYNPVSNVNGAITMSAVAQDTSQNFFNSVPWQMDDETNSNARVAHLKRSFTHNQPEGNWHYGSTTNTGGVLFGMVGTDKTVVDITFEVIYAVGGNGASFAQYTVVVAGANVGTLYSRVPMTNLVPQDVNLI